MGILMDKINFEKLKEVKKWYKEHPEKYGKMIKESTDEELYKDILESGCSADIQGGLFGLEEFIEGQKKKDKNNN